MKKLFGIFALMLLVVSSLSLVSASEDSIVTKYLTETDDAYACLGEVDANGEGCVYPVPFNPKIDVVFLIDSTGSMSDEIRSVKTHIVNIVEEVEEGKPSPDLKVGIVTYRDHEEQEREYLLRNHELTRDVDEALGFLKKIEARGGGDYPEAVADGLNEAVNEMNWRNNAIKLIFLIGDAAPHGEGSRDGSYVQGCPDGHNYEQAIEDAIEEKIHIYTISGSGMDAVGVRIWKEIAAETGGEYEQLTYVRRDVDQYYEEEGIDPEFAAEAKTDRDYDRKSNSILTNSLGRFAKSAVMGEAMDAGVVYEKEKEVEKDDGEIVEKEKTIDYEKIISGHTIKDVETTEYSGLGGFFKRVFVKFSFWS